MRSTVGSLVGSQLPEDLARRIQRDGRLVCSMAPAHSDPVELPGYPPDDCLPYSPRTDVEPLDGEHYERWLDLLEQGCGYDQGPLIHYVAGKVGRPADTSRMKQRWGEWWR